MGTEFELKYKANQQTQARLLDLSDQWQTIAMETTYYDTPDGSLSRRHFTLRRRLENGVSICTIKTPAPDGSRGEWETEADNILSAVPELCKLGAPAELPLLIVGGLIPVCGARFTRRCAQLSQGDALLELALDEGILFSGQRTVPLCEVEVELKSGSRIEALALGSTLQEKFGLTPERKSKFRRALSLYQEANHGTE